MSGVKPSYVLAPTRRAFAGEVWDYYQRSLEAIDCLKRRFKSGEDLPPGSLFEGMPLGKANEALAMMKQELDHEVTLALLSSFEAVFQVDVKERVQRRRPARTDTLSQDLRTAYEANNKRPPLERVLEIWKEHTGQSQLIGNFKTVLNVRHWLAHGRYWERRGIKWSPASVWEIARQMFDVLPDLPSLDPLPT